jgi:hypothetical protein
MDQKVNVWKANFTNGIILGLIGIVYSLVMYFLDLSLNRTQGFIFIVIQFVVLYFLVKSYRDNFLHGSMTYGQALGAGIVICLYYAIIIAIFTYILYAIIDPDLLNKQLAASEEMMLKRGMSDAQIEAGRQFQEKIMKPEIMAPITIFGNMLWGFILSLIIGIFVRKESNPLIETPVNQ